MPAGLPSHCPCPRALHSGRGSSGRHTPASSSASHRQHPRRGQHKVSISEAHFCAMDIEPGRKESRLLSMMDGFSRGLPRVVLKGPGWSHAGFTASQHALVRVRAHAGGLSALPPASPTSVPACPPSPSPQHPSFQFILVQNTFSVLLLESKVPCALYYRCGYSEVGGMAWGPQLEKHSLIILHLKISLSPFPEC